MAIAFVNTAYLGTPSTTNFNASYTCGSNPNTVLFVCFEGDGSLVHDDITGVSYGGNSLTFVTKLLSNVVHAYCYIYYLVNPPSGSNTLNITCSNNHLIQPNAIEYSGVNQITPVDVSTTTVSATGTGVVTQSLTSTVDADWMLLFVCTANDNGSVTSGGTVRLANAATFARLCDSNGVISPAGSYSMTFTGTANDGWATGALGLMMEPAPTVTYVPPRRAGSLLVNRTVYI